MSAAAQLKPINLIEDLSIEQARQEKWRRGQLKYGLVFQGDPIVHLYEELLDAMNYCEQASKEGFPLIAMQQRLAREARILIEMHRRRKAGGLIL